MAQAPESRPVDAPDARCRVRSGRPELDLPETTPPVGTVARQSIRVVPPRVTLCAARASAPGGLGWRRADVRPCRLLDAGRRSGDRVRRSAADDGGVAPSWS